LLLNPLSLQLQCSVRFGSANVTTLFDLSSFRRKIFYFFSFCFSSCPPPVEAGCKGTVAFFSFASGLKKYFSRCFATGAVDRHSTGC
jgi:hypothetical protein